MPQAKTHGHIEAEAKAKAAQAGHS